MCGWLREARRRQGAPGRIRCCAGRTSLHTPQTGTRKEQLKNHKCNTEIKRSVTAPELSGGGVISWLLLQSPPCASMIKGEKRGGEGGESKKEKEKKKENLFKRWQTVIGLEDWLCCFAWVLFFFLLQPRCLKYLYPQHRTLKPKGEIGKQQPAATEVKKRSPSANICNDSTDVICFECSFLSVFLSAKMCLITEVCPG